ncbi:hypothetical protein KY343_06915 [Candidatus Woesearchaeota archaeon]|nr:hypothetical protein [Candidatus Woesearchaeota archaeon]
MKKISLLFLSFFGLILMSAFAAADTVLIDFESFNEYDNVTTVPTSQGNVGFYMTNAAAVQGANIGDYLTLTPTGEYPVVAESDNMGPGADGDIYKPTDNTNIVAYTYHDGTRYYDEYVTDANGNDLGINMLTDTPLPVAEQTGKPYIGKLYEHMYSKGQAIVIDLAGITDITSVSFVCLDLDHNEFWKFVALDSSGKVIDIITIGPGVSGGDGKAYNFLFNIPNIAKIALWGWNNQQNSGIVGYAFDNIEIEVEETACEDYTTDLIAGGGNPKSAIDVGEVTISSDGETLEVTYQTEDGWEMTETHLEVECDLEDVPQTQPNKKGKGGGNPIPGHFDYNNNFDPAVTEHTVIINLDDLCCTDPVIAAHAVVQKVTILNPTPYYADAVFDYNQGLRKDGTPVRPGRSVPEQGLAFETGQDETNFFSLGFGGWLIAEFNCPIRNGPGDDVKVIEDTWGSYPLEKAELYASNDGTNWFYLGLADNTVRDPVYNIHTIASFDLGSMAEAKYIKVVDVTDPALYNSRPDADGYDLNAIESLQNCVEIQEETAWGKGSDFPGDNWAMYFSYDLSDCYDGQCLGLESNAITGAAVTILEKQNAWLGLISMTAIIALTVVYASSMKRK